MTYCPHCGSELTRTRHEGRSRAYCGHCQRVLYEQLKVGAGAIIEQDEQLLLLRRTREPFRDTWNLPSGYCEVDEAPSVAAVREVSEEIGLEVSLVGLEDVYFFDDDPRGNGVLIVYRVQVIGGTLLDTPEATQATYFTPEDIPSVLSGGGHDKAVAAWRSRHS